MPSLLSIFDCQKTGGHDIYIYFFLVQILFFTYITWLVCDNVFLLKEKDAWSVFLVTFCTKILLLHMGIGQLAKPSTIHILAQ